MNQRNNQKRQFLKVSVMVLLLVPILCLIPYVSAYASAWITPDGATQAETEAENDAFLSDNVGINIVGGFEWVFKAIIWVISCIVQLIGTIINLVIKVLIGGYVDTIVLQGCGLEGGSTWNAYYEFSLTSGNVYGVAASKIYAVLGPMSLVFITIRFFMGLSKGAFKTSSQEGYGLLKETVSGTVIAIMAVILMPQYYNIGLKVSHWAIRKLYTSTGCTALSLAASQLCGFGNIELYDCQFGIDADLNTASDIIGNFMLIIFQVIVVVAMAVISLLIAYDYVMLCLSFLAHFIAFPFRCIASTEKIKEQLSDWNRQFYELLLTPIIDVLIIMIIRYVMVALSDTFKTTGLLDTLQDIPRFIPSICIVVILMLAFFPMRTTIRKYIGVSSTAAEGLSRGVSGNMMKLAGAAMLAKKGLSSMKDKERGAKADEAMAGKEEAASEKEQEERAFSAVDGKDSVEAPIDISNRSSVDEKMAEDFTRSDENDKVKKEDQTSPVPMSARTNNNTGSKEKQLIGEKHSNTKTSEEGVSEGDGTKGKKQESLDESSINPKEGTKVKSDQQGRDAKEGMNKTFLEKATSTQSTKNGTVNGTDQETPLAEELDNLNDMETEQNQELNNEADSVDPKVEELDPASMSKQQDDSDEAGQIDTGADNEVSEQEDVHQQGGTKQELENDLPLNARRKQLAERQAEVARQLQREKDKAQTLAEREGALNAQKAEINNARQEARDSYQGKIDEQDSIAAEETASARAEELLSQSDPVNKAAHNQEAAKHRLAEAEARRTSRRLTAERNGVIAQLSEQIQAVEGQIADTKNARVDAQNNVKNLQDGQRIMQAETKDLDRQIQSIAGTRFVPGSKEQEDFGDYARAFATLDNFDSPEFRGAFTHSEMAAMYRDRAKQTREAIKNAQRSALVGVAIGGVAGAMLGGGTVMAAGAGAGASVGLDMSDQYFMEERGKTYKERNEQIIQDGIKKASGAKAVSFGAETANASYKKGAFYAQMEMEDGKMFTAVSDAKKGPARTSGSGTIRMYRKEKDGSYSLEEVSAFPSPVAKAFAEGKNLAVESPAHVDGYGEVLLGADQTKMLDRLRGIDRSQADALEEAMIQAGESEAQDADNRYIYSKNRETGCFMSDAASDRPLQSPKETYGTKVQINYGPLYRGEMINEPATNKPDAPLGFMRRHSPGETYGYVVQGKSIEAVRSGLMMAARRVSEASSIDVDSTYAELPQQFPGIVSAYEKIVQSNSIAAATPKEMLSGAAAETTLIYRALGNISTGFTKEDEQVLMSDRSGFAKIIAERAATEYMEEAAAKQDEYAVHAQHTGVIYDALNSENPSLYAGAMEIFDGIARAFLGLPTDMKRPKH